MNLSRVARFVKPACLVRNEDSRYEIVGPMKFSSLSPEIWLTALDNKYTDKHCGNQPRSQGPVSSYLEVGRDRTLGTRLQANQIPCPAYSTP